MALKVLSLFSGIGAFEKALKNLDIDYEVVNYCEIDKYASKAYAAIHDVSEDLNLGDITKVDTFELPNDIDLICGGFPCQDVSLSGKQKGIIKGETRSGLMYEMMRIIEGTKPKFVIAENVKNLLAKKFRPQLEEYLCFLNDNGYDVTMDILDSKDYGIPQSRQRVFIIGVKRGNGKQ